MASKFARFIGMVLVLGLVFMAGGFMVYLFEEVANEGFELMLAGLGALGAMSWFIFRGPVGKGIASMLEGNEGSTAMLAGRVADLEDRLQEVTLETQRFLEIEERLDFTERLLAQQGESSAREEPR
jgi:hypothetical protein